MISMAMVPCPVATAGSSKGWIKVYDEDTGNLLVTFTENDWNKYTSSNPYKYEIPVKHIRIETSALNDWIMNNKGRTRVLVMHHPIAHLTDDMQEEINAMCRNGLEYIIAGHTHSQN